MQNNRGVMNSLSALSFGVSSVQAAAFTLRGRLWTESGFRPGRVTLEGTHIAGVEFEPEESSAPADFDFGEALITPGLIDLQLNGGLGHDFTRQPDTVETVAEALPRWGVTGFLPTFITAPLETYRAALNYLRDRPQSRGATVLGAHLEGPYLNPQFKGAHEAALLREPSLPEVRQLVEAGPLRMMTLAPEEPGSLELIGWLSERGVLLAGGHSGATYEQGQAAIESGLRCATHLFNAMPPLHHRKPGLVGAVLDNGQVWANLIVDGIHLHPATVRMIYRLKGWERLTLVTDAMAGLGMAPGRYDLAGQAVVVDGISARLAESPDTLAGSILTLNGAVQNMIKFTGCPPHEAVGMASLNPARLLGLDDRKGRLAPGYEADLVVFSPRFEPILTLVAGEVVFEAVRP